MPRGKYWAFSALQRRSTGHAPRFLDLSQLTGRAALVRTSVQRTKITRFEVGGPHQRPILSGHQADCSGSSPARRPLGRKSMPASVSVT